MPQRIVHVSLVMGLFLALTGCAPWATYPPIPGATQMGRPDYEPGPSIMAEAIRFTYERHAQGTLPAGEIVFNLPEGIPAEVYDRVGRRLSPTQARPMTGQDTRAIHVKSMRVRGFDSQVDVVYPRHDGMHEMVMLTLRQEFPNRQRVTGSRLWRIHALPPQANYVPPARPDRRQEKVTAQAPTPIEDSSAAATTSEAQAAVTSDDDR